MDINFFFEDISSFQFDEKLYINWIEIVAAEHGKEVGEISFIFCSDEYLIKINREYLNHDFYTDIVTFDYVEGNVINGDLFISIDRIKENAESFGVSFQNEFSRVFIHGILHLCGFPDKTDEEAAIMRANEETALQVLKKLLD